LPSDALDGFLVKFQYQGQKEKGDTGFQQEENRHKPDVAHQQLGLIAAYGYKGQRCQKTRYQAREQENFKQGLDPIHPGLSGSGLQYWRIIHF
jgi:hypothetical protein